jgi:hypothetical protein
VKLASPAPQPGVCDSCSESALVTPLLYDTGTIGVWMLCQACKQLIRQSMLGDSPKAS